jgi:putative tricarboxylic transport membrane protein
MVDPRKNLYSSLLFLLFSVYISIESYRLGLGKLSMPGPGTFPFIASVALGIISASLLIRTVLKEPPSKTLGELSEDSEPIKWQNIFLTLAAMLVYVVIFSWLGFVLSTFVVMIFLVWAVGRAPWQVSLVTALSITIASYLLFEVALDAQLPKGILDFLF